MSCDFSTTLSAKWILAGEHSVVRQYPALIFPLQHYQFSLAYEKTISPWKVVAKGIYQSEIEALFFSTLEHALSLSNAQHVSRTGLFTIQNSIPLGNGLGASAAFCLAISRWLASQKFIELNDIYFHAKKLEGLFHGQSSGIDIVGVGADTGRYFQAGNHMPITQTWQPHWYLSSTNSRSKTKYCIEKVNSLWQSNADFARSVDKQMTDSVNLALQALQTPRHGTTRLSEAINLGQSCFKQWGLIDSNLQCHINELRNAGAIACKPTGSGNGGYIISLWTEPVYNTPWTLVPLKLAISHKKTVLTKEHTHDD